MNKTEILIIDDEPQLRKLLCINLESNDYKVIEAETGKQGIQLAASFNPELILLDLGLPDIDGHEILKELRTWYQKSIIILSVQNSEDDIVKALDNGASDYLSKPFRTAELLARIRAAIRRNNNQNGEQIIYCSDIEIDLVAKTVKKNNELIKLTTTEYKLLV
ncbi:MAG: response regulator transcription factor [Bacteroidales bacterium]